MPVLLLGSGLCGCSFSDQYPTGLLTVDWSIEGEIEPLDCLDTESDYLNVVLFDRGGYAVADEVAICEDFTLTLELDAGRYYPEVTLFDRLDRATTFTLELNSVLVLRDDDLLIEVDFLGSDFF